MKNIILIVIDSVRRGFFSNYIKNSISELSKDFVEYCNCSSIYTTTCLSHYTIFFGDYWKKSKNMNFPSQLKKHGYKNKSFCNGAIITGYPRKPNLKSPLPSKNKMIEDLNIEFSFKWNREYFGNQFKDYYGAADDINQKIPEKWKNYLINNRNQNNFIFLHFWNAHYNYKINKHLNNPINGRNYKEIGKELIRRVRKKIITEKFVKTIYLRRIYEILNLYVNDLFQILKNENIYNDSLIILTSDHGEGLGDEGRYCNKRFYTLYTFLMNIYEILREKVKILPPIKKYFSWKWDFTNFFHGSKSEFQKEIPLFVKFPNNEFGGLKYMKKTTLFDLIHTVNDMVEEKLDIYNNLGCSLYQLMHQTNKNRELLQLDKIVSNLIKSNKF